MKEIYDTDNGENQIETTEEGAVFEVYSDINGDGKPDKDEMIKVYLGEKQIFTEVHCFYKIGY